MSVEEGDYLRFKVQARESTSDTRVIHQFDWQVETFVIGPDTDVLADMVDEMDTRFGTISALYPTTFVGEYVNAVNLTKRERIGQTDWEFQGTGVLGEVLPPQIAAEALVATKKIGVTARKYLGPFLESQQADGTWIAAALTALDNFNARFGSGTIVGTVTGNTYLQGIARVVDLAVVSFQDFLGATGRVVDQARTQRRRTSGVGLT